MTRRAYIDTSVFGGYFDKEFSEHTIPLFERVRDEEFVILFSSLTHEELLNAPENVKSFVKKLKAKNTKLLTITDEAVDLATEYIRKKL